MIAELVEFAPVDARPVRDVDERSEPELDSVDEIDDDKLESVPESEPVTDSEPHTVGVFDPVADTVSVSKSNPPSAAASVTDTVDVSVSVFDGCLGRLSCARSRRCEWGGRCASARRLRG
jgi:hypothetical protein